MKKVKILWAIALGLAYVVALSFTSALIVDTTGEWYEGLALPTYTPNKVLFSVIWGVIYCVFALTFAETFTKKIKKRVIIGYVFIAVFNLLFLLFFFRLHNLLVSFVFCLISTIVVLLHGFAMIKHGFRLSWLFLPVLVWYVFCFSISYYVIMNN
mgnify:FL=1